MRGLVVFDGLRELGFHVGVDSLENVLVAGDGRVCIPYLRENGDGVGEGGGSGKTTREACLTSILPHTSPNLKKEKNKISNRMKKSPTNLCSVTMARPP